MSDFDFDEDAIDQMLKGDFAGGIDFEPLDREQSSELIGGGPVNWRTLSDEVAPEVWQELRAFVEWLTVRYNIDSTTVPNCWFQHSALVEELSALHTAHTASFNAADGGYGPIGWHERLHAWRQRIGKAYSAGCSRTHVASPERSWAGAVDEVEWESWSTTAHGV